MADFPKQLNFLPPSLGPLLYVPLPSVPSGTVVNPLSGQVTDFAYSVNLAPAVGQGWTWPAQQVLVANGNQAPNYWASFFGNGGASPTDFLQNAGGSEGALGASAGAQLVGNKIVGWQPGKRNFAWGVQNGQRVFYSEGVLVFSAASTHNPVQQPTFWIGRDNVGAQILVDYILTDFRFDTNIVKVLTPSGNPGPGLKAQRASFGDSITVGFNAGITQSSYAKQICDNNFAAEFWWNAATNGATVTQIKSYWDNWGIRQTLGKVTVLIGVNDLIAGAAATTIFATYQTMLDSMRSNVARIIIGSVIPFGNNAGWSAGKETQRLALNTLLSNYAVTNSTQVRFADTSAALAGVLPAMNAAFDSGDGLHPNQAGQNAIYSTFAPLL